MTRPLKKGTNRAPTMKITAGGSALFIVIFPSFHQQAQELGHKNQTHAGHKTIYRIKTGRRLPGEVDFFVQKKVEHLKYRCASTVFNGYKIKQSKLQLNHSLIPSYKLVLFSTIIVEYSYNHFCCLCQGKSRKF